MMSDEEWAQETKDFIRFFCWVVVWGTVLECAILYFDLFPHIVDTIIDAYTSESRK